MESSSNKFIKKIFKGVLISLVVSFVLLAIFAIVLTYTSVSENTIVPVIIVVTGISILVGTILESRKIVKNGIWLGGIIGGITSGVNNWIGPMISKKLYCNQVGYEYANMDIDYQEPVSGSRDDRRADRLDRRQAVAVRVLSEDGGENPFRHACRLLCRQPQRCYFKRGGAPFGLPCPRFRRLA